MEHRAVQWWDAVAWRPARAELRERDAVHCEVGLPSPCAYAKLVDRRRQGSDRGETAEALPRLGRSLRTRRGAREPDRDGDQQRALRAHSSIVRGQSEPESDVRNVTGSVESCRPLARERRRAKAAAARCGLYLELQFEQVSATG